MNRLAIGCVLVALSAPVAAQSGKLGRVNVAGVSVSGLTPQDARRRLTRELGRKLETRVSLSDGHRAVYRRRRDVGIGLNLASMMQSAKAGKKFVPLRFKVNRTQMQRALRRVAPRFATQGRGARVTEVKGRIRIVPEQDSRLLNVGGSVVRASQAVEKNAGTRKLPLMSKVTKPTLTRARLKGITGRLASFTTRFNPGKVKRTINMGVAIRAINGTLLSPNEVFSLNGVVGDRTQARGYRTAVIFKNGYKTPGIGGGVSQVTGTLFNAALLAGLPIVTYRVHSRPVAYLPIGRDATVTYGSFDMKFKNNTGAPIFISYQIRGSSCTATLYGKKVPGQKVSLTVRSQSQGPRHKTAQLYRTIRRGNKVVKQKIGDSVYSWNQDPED